MQPKINPSRNPETNGGRMVKRGYHFDPECGKTTHRLRLAQSILRDAGVESTVAEHADKCMLSPAQRYNRVFGYSYNCSCGIGVDPTPTWPEWATGEMFDLAYRLADEIQTERGAHNQREAQLARVAAGVR